MHISGYNAKYRRDIISGAIKRYQDLMSEVSAGSRLLYRSKEAMRLAKLEKGGISAATWHLRRNIKQTLNIPITPNAELASSLKDRISGMVGPDQGNTLVLEQGGQGLLGGIAKADPFRPDGCRWHENDKCIVDGDCMDSNLVYRISCEPCLNSNSDGNQGQHDADANQGQHHADANQLRRTSTYIGQTGRTIHARMRDHVDGLRRGEATCPLYKHVQHAHDGNISDARFTAKKITQSRTNLHRLLSEAEQIQSNTHLGLFNSKSEYRGTKIIRMEVNRIIV